MLESVFGSEIIAAFVRCVYEECCCLQGTQTTVHNEHAWLSPRLTRHGISSGQPACVLADDESNLVFLKDAGKAAALLRAIEENRVDWQFPEETALPVLLLLISQEPRSSTQKVPTIRLIAGLEKDLRIRFFPRITASPVVLVAAAADGILRISDLTSADVLKRLQQRQRSVLRYRARLGDIMAGFNARPACARRNPEAKHEIPRLEVRWHAAGALLNELRAACATDLAVTATPHAGLAPAVAEHLALLCPSSAHLFRRATEVPLAELAIDNAERWASKIPDYLGAAAAPRVEGATPLQQQLSDTLFVLAERVPKNFLVGAHHQRLTYACFPWSTLLVGVASAADAAAEAPVVAGMNARRERVIAELVALFVARFPGYPMPNPLVQGLHTLLVAAKKEHPAAQVVLLPLKGIAQDLFRCSGWEKLSWRYNESARRAIDLVMLEADGRTLTPYARAYGVTHELLERIRASRERESAAFNLELAEDIKATEALRNKLLTEQWTRPTAQRAAHQAALDVSQRRVTELMRRLYDNEQVVCAAALELVPHVVAPDEARRESEDHLTAIYVLTVPLLPALQLQALRPSNAMAYAEGAWKAIEREYAGNGGCIRKLGPMIANLRLALSLAGASTADADLPAWATTPHKRLSAFVFKSGA